MNEIKKNIIYVMLICLFSLNCKAVEWYDQGHITYDQLTKSIHTKRDIGITIEDYNFLIDDNEHVSSNAKLNIIKISTGQTACIQLDDFNWDKGTWTVASDGLNQKLPIAFYYKSTNHEKIMVMRFNPTQHFKGGADDPWVSAKHLVNKTDIYGMDVVDSSSVSLVALMRIPALGNVAEAEDKDLYRHDGAMAVYADYETLSSTYKCSKIIFRTLNSEHGAYGPKDWSIDLNGSVKNRIGISSAGKNFSWTTDIDSHGRYHIAMLINDYIVVANVYEDSKFFDTGSSLDGASAHVKEDLYLSRSSSNPITGTQLFIGTVHQKKHDKDKAAQNFQNLKIYKKFPII